MSNLGQIGMMGKRELTSETQVLQSFSIFVFLKFLQENVWKWWKKTHMFHLHGDESHGKNTPTKQIRVIQLGSVSAPASAKKQCVVNPKNSTTPRYFELCFISDFKFQDSSPLNYVFFGNDAWTKSLTKSCYPQNRGRYNITNPNSMHCSRGSPQNIPYICIKMSPI